MIIGCYGLDLYCDRAESVQGAPRDGHEWNEFPHQFAGTTRGECLIAARRKGWLVNLRADKALCPKCSKKRRGIQ